MPSPTLVKRGRGPWLAARLHGYTQNPASMQRTSNICLHLYLAGSVTNSWSLLPTPSFSPSSPTYAHFLTQHTSPTGLGLAALPVWQPVLEPSKWPESWHLCLLQLPNSQGKIRPKTSWFPTSSSSSLLLSNCLRFPSHCSEKHSFLRGALSCPQTFTVRRK